MNTSSSAHGAKPAHAVTAETDGRNEILSDAPNVRVGVRSRADAAKPIGYGLPCANCGLYYPANLDICPTCNSKERVSPNLVPKLPKVQATAEPVPDPSVIEKEREAFLEEFKSQLFAAHAEVANAPKVCILAEHHTEDSEPAVICKPCFDRLQERIDVCEAALHIDLKEAAQIVYDAVWADPSDPSKTYSNAASALLGELRKRAGVSSLLGPFQPLGN